MAERDSLEEKEGIVLEYVRAVQRFSFEELLAPERKNQVVEDTRAMLEFIADSIEEMGSDLLAGGWPLSDFARTVLSGPVLPAITDPPSQEAKSVEGHDWWSELVPEQTEVLWQILKEDFGLDKGKREAIPGYEGYEFVFSEKPMVIRSDGPVQVLQPLLVFDESGGTALSCLKIKAPSPEDSPKEG